MSNLFKLVKFEHAIIFDHILCEALVSAPPPPLALPLLCSVSIKKAFFPNLSGNSDKFGKKAFSEGRSHSSSATIAFPTDATGKTRLFREGDEKDDIN